MQIKRPIGKTPSTYLPIKLFLIISAVYNLPSIICALFFSDVDILFLSESARSPVLAYEYLMLLIWSSVVTLVTFSLLSPFLRFVKTKTTHFNGNQNLLFSALSLFYFSVAFVSVLSYGASSYFVGYNTDPFAETSASINALYFATEFIFGAALLVYFSGVKQTVLSYVFLALLILGFGLFIVRMKRLELLVILIALLVTRNLDGKPFKYFMLFVAACVFSLIGAYRNGISELGEMMLMSMLSFTLESNFSSNSVFVYLGNADYYAQFHEYFIRYFTLPLALVPQFLMPFDKADMLIAFPPALGASEISTLSPGGASKLISALLFQGGCWGVMFGSMLAGVVLFLYRWMLKKYASIFFIRNCIVLSMVSLLMHAMRDSPLMAIKLQLQFMLIVMLIYKFDEVCRKKSI